VPALLPVRIATKVLATRATPWVGMVFAVAAMDTGIADDPQFAALAVIL